MTTPHSIILTDSVADNANLKILKDKRGRVIPK